MKPFNGIRCPVKDIIMIPEELRDDLLDSIDWAGRGILIENMCPNFGRRRKRYKFLLH